VPFLEIVLASYCAKVKSLENRLCR
jgi:hypothetical protein